MIRITFAVAITLLCAGLPAVAIECVDWAGTMPPPVHHAELTGSAVLIHGDYLLIAEEGSFTVADATSPEFPVVGTCALPASHVMRIRSIGDRVYVVLQDRGVGRLDITNPAEPFYVDVFDPGVLLSDLAGFDGGAIVAAQDGAFYVLDGLDSGECEVVGQGEVPGTTNSMAASGGHAYLNGRYGVTPVCLLDPASPVVGSPESCTPSNPYNYLRYGGDVVVRGSHVFAAIRYTWHDLGRSEYYVQKFDATDPFELSPTICMQIDREVDRLAMTSDWLVAHSRSVVTFFSPVDLHVEAATMIPETVSRQVGLDADDESVAVVDITEGLLWLVPTPVASIDPVAVRPEWYDPLGGGRFGLETYSALEYVGRPVHHALVYDQSEGLEARLVYEEHLDIESHCSYSTRLAAQDERWAVMWRRFHYDEGEFGYEYTTESLSAIDAEGNLFPLDTWDRANVVLSESLLWVVATNDGSTMLEVIHLDGDEPEYLAGPVPIPHGRPRVIGDRLLLVRSTMISVYDISAPLAVVHLGDLDAERVLQLNWIPMETSGNRLLVPTDGGVAVFTVGDGPLEPIAERGWIDLNIPSYAPTAMALNGERLAVGTREGWHLVSLADLDRPMISSSVPGMCVDGLVWADDHVYVGAHDSVYLYDTSDEVSPSWVGQATALGELQGTLAARPDCILNGRYVIPRDCDDGVSIEDDQPGEGPPADMPRAVRLRHPNPNPFNPHTTITFDLARRTHATITIHDLRGCAVATLADALFASGKHSRTWCGIDDQGRELPSGTYLVRLVTDAAIRTTKAVLIR